MPDLAISKDTADELVDRTKKAILEDTETILMHVEERIDSLFTNTIDPRLDRLQKMGDEWLSRIDRMIPVISITPKEK